MTPAGSEFICPACRSDVEDRDDGYSCSSCNHVFPILFGIPDFRMSGDQYLSLEEEREKAGRLFTYARDHDFASLVRFYYSITDDVPDRLVPTFVDYVVQAAARFEPAIRALAPKPGDSLLDLGCGSGGALVSALQFEKRTGVDIALRWLVIAQKRLTELDIEARLVCADAEALPFREHSFTHILSSDLVENTRSPAAVIKSAAAVLERGGRLYVSSSNRRWIGPHPATGVWEAGLLPQNYRTAALERRHGVDILRAVRFVSPSEIREIAKASGLQQVDARPLDLDPKRLTGRSALFKSIARIYSALAGVPLFRAALVAAGPVFQSVFVKE